MHEQPVRIRTVKRHLQHLCGQPRFRQRLLLPDGEMLSDDVVLLGPLDVQLILLPFEASSEAQVAQLQQAARKNHTATMEELLQRPQDPDLGPEGLTSPLHFGGISTWTPKVSR